MSKLMGLFVFALFCGQQANGLLQCYSCDSTKDKDCHKIKKNTEMKLLNCTPRAIQEYVPDFLDGIVNIDFFQNSVNDEIIPMVCQKIELTKSDELITYRGCQLDIERSNACQYAQSQLDLIGSSEIKIKTCDLCVNDSCNFSSHTITDIHLVLVLLAFIILFN